MDGMRGNAPNLSMFGRRQSLWQNFLLWIWKSKFWLLVVLFGYSLSVSCKNRNRVEVLLDRAKENSVSVVKAGEELAELSGKYLALREAYAKAKLQYAERVFTVLSRTPKFSGSPDIKKLQRDLYKHRFVGGLVDFYAGHGRARRFTYLMEWLEACWKYGDPKNRPNGKHAWSIYHSMSILMVESQLTNIAVQDIHNRGMSGEVTSAQILLADLPRLFKAAGCKGDPPKLKWVRKKIIIVSRGDAWKVKNVVLMMLTLLDEKMDKRKTATGAIAAYNGSRGNPAESPYIEKIQKNMELLRAF